MVKLFAGWLRAPSSTPYTLPKPGVAPLESGVDRAR